MILLHAGMTHEHVTIRGTKTTQAGRDVVLVNGHPHTVATTHSGWCLDGRCDQCQYPHCSCTCHNKDAA